MYNKRFLVLALLGACSASSVGDPCSLRVCGVNNAADNANTVCEPSNECADLICVGQGQGLNTGLVEEFCSTDCQSDEDCPQGFSCDTVSNIGSNATRTLCLKE